MLTVSSTSSADVVALRRGVLRLGRRLRAQRPSVGGLSANALSVLAHLAIEGASSPGAIAQAEAQQPQSLTRTFAELEQRGWIVRSKNPADQRQQMLDITVQGLGALMADVQSRDRWLTEALQTLTPAERQLLAIAGPLMERVAQHGAQAGWHNPPESANPA
jgi:DNA-binding MarR family transcriptional regulator